MINAKIAKIFYQMAEYFMMQDVAFKPQAYERAGRLIEALDQDLEEIYEQGGVKALMEVEGIGRGLAEKVAEFVETGRVKEYEKLKKECPVDLGALSAIEGLGPKMIKALYDELGVKTLKDLERAAKKHLVQELPRFGEKVQQNILRGIEFSQKGQGRFLLGRVLSFARQIEERLKSLKFVSEAVAAGSVRRRKETVGDIDILVTCHERAKRVELVDYFCAMPEVEKVLAQGETKSLVRLDLGFDADVRVVPKESFGAALQYFTGSKDHNVALRKIAIEKGYKLNEYGLFKTKNQKPKIKNKNEKLKNGIIVAGKTEEEVYQALGLEYIEPELRENMGEIEAAQNGKLPKLVECGDIKGDLQMHTNWSDGAHTIKEMAEAAKKIGYEYIAITDHTGELRIAGGMDEKTILQYMAEIDKINKEISGIKILKGVEVNIRKDGTLDISDEVLAQLDIILAAVHSNFKMPKAEMTKRICRAMENKNVDIIAHPTGRIIQKREGYQVDFEELFSCAKRTGTILEINSYPDRLDLNDFHIKKAIEAGVKLSFGTDSHAKNQLTNMEFGVSQARRGWAEKGDIINTMGYNEIREFLKNK